MLSVRTLIDPLVRTVAGRLARLRQTVAAAGAHLRERVATAVGQEAARAARDVVRRLLDLPGPDLGHPGPEDRPYYPEPEFEPETSTRRPGRARPGWSDDPWADDEPEAWTPPAPARPARWRRALAALGQALLVWLSHTAGRWPVLAAVATGVTLMAAPNPN